MEVQVNHGRLQPYRNTALDQMNSFETQSKRQQINQRELKNMTPHPLRFVEKNRANIHTAEQHLMNFKIGKLRGRREDRTSCGAGFKAQAPAFYDPKPFVS